MSKRQETEEERALASGFSRRQFLRGVGAVGAGTALVTDLLGVEEAEAEPKPLAEPPAGTTLKQGVQAVTLNVNGKEMTMQIEPRTTLLNALRNHAEPPITGPKLVCDQGACGACTVHMDGKSVYGCMQLAVDTIGKKITTVEGLTGQNGELSAVQEAFVHKDAMMCGFCTPGFVMSATALLKSNPNPTHEEIQKGCAGNLCRCGTYPHIFEAVAEAAQKMRGGA
jgi:xanthine dehydrogenase YagT iron-sulfur-binding subunit